MIFTRWWHLSTLMVPNLCYFPAISINMDTRLCVSWLCFQTSIPCLVSKVRYYFPELPKSQMAQHFQICLRAYVKSLVQTVNSQNGSFQYKFDLPFRQSRNLFIGSRTGTCGGALVGLFGSDSIRRLPLFSQMLQRVSGSQWKLLACVRRHKVRANMKAHAQ